MGLGRDWEGIKRAEQGLKEGLGGQGGHQEEGQGRSWRGIRRAGPGQRLGGLGGPEEGGGRAHEAPAAATKMSW